MSGNSKWVEMGQNGYPAENYLGYNPEQLARRQPKEGLLIGVLAAPTHNSRHRRDDGDNQHKGQKSVTEFDPRMERSLGLVRNWRKGARGTAGPGRTTEARSRQPYRPASDDNSSLQGYQRGVNNLFQGSHWLSLPSVSKRALSLLSGREVNHTPSTGGSPRITQHFCCEKE